MIGWAPWSRKPLKDSAAVSTRLIARRIAPVGANAAVRFLPMLRRIEPVGAIEPVTDLPTFLLTLPVGVSEAVGRSFTVPLAVKPENERTPINARVIAREVLPLNGSEAASSLPIPLDAMTPVGAIEAVNFFPVFLLTAPLNDRLAVRVWK